MKKNILISIILVVGSVIAKIEYDKYAHKKDVVYLEQAIFPLVKSLSVGGTLTCEPAFITLSQADLTYYCDPSSKEKSELSKKLRDKIKFEIESWKGKSTVFFNSSMVYFTSDIVMKHSK